MVEKETHTHLDWLMVDPGLTLAGLKLQMNLRWHKNMAHNDCTVAHQIYKCTKYCTKQIKLTPHQPA